MMDFSGSMGLGAAQPGGPNYGAMSQGQTQPPKQADGQITGDSINQRMQSAYATPNSAPTSAPQPGFNSGSQMRQQLGSGGDGTMNQNQMSQMRQQQAGLTPTSAPYQPQSASQMRQEMGGDAYGNQMGAQIPPKTAGNQYGLGGAASMYGGNQMGRGGIGDQLGGQPNQQMNQNQQNMGNDMRQGQGMRGAGNQMGAQIPPKNPGYDSQMVTQPMRGKAYRTFGDNM